MRKSLFLSMLFCSLTMPISAETHLSGDITQPVIDSTGNPYIVDQDITIPANRQVKITQGCIFLFRNFAGLNLNGRLTVTGSEDHPVIFTSVNDSTCNVKSTQTPNPFDWNGILIAKESGATTMKNFALRYSVYGIKSQDTLVSLQHALFKQNGQFHFTINDKIQYVQDNIPYSYNVKEPESSVAIKTTASQGNKNAKPDKSILRFSSVGIGVIGCAAGTYFLTQWLPLHKDLTLSATDFAAKYPPAQNADAKWKSLNATAKNDAAGLWIGYGVAILGLTGFTLTFVF